MTAAPEPECECARLDALAAAAILDTGEEFFFEEAVDSVSHALATPIAAISLVDRGRQWFKAQRGMPVCETAREHAFCAHAILHDTPLVIGDARIDERFHDNPFVTEAPYIVAYAGAPIMLSGGLHLGAVCAIDTQPRDWTAFELAQLREITKLVSHYITLRVAMLKMNHQRYADLAIFGDSLPRL